MPQRTHTRREPTHPCYSIDSSTLVEEGFLDWLVTRGHLAPDRVTPNTFYSNAELPDDGSVVNTVSLFRNVPGPHSVDPKVNLSSANWFHANVIKHINKSKYHKGLISHQRTYPGFRRFYLDKRLERIAKALMEAPFSVDQVVVMEAPESPFYEGLIWRYLLLNRTKNFELRCTELDHMSPAFHRDLVSSPMLPETLEFWVSETQLRKDKGRAVCMGLGIFRLNITDPETWMPVEPDQWPYFMNGFIDLLYTRGKDLPSEFAVAKESLDWYFHERAHRIRLPYADAFFLHLWFWNRRTIERLGDRLVLHSAQTKLYGKVRIT